MNDRPVGQLRTLVSMAHLCGNGTQLGQPFYYLRDDFKTIMRIPGASFGHPRIFVPEGFRQYTFCCESLNGFGWVKFVVEFIENEKAA